MFWLNRKIMTGENAETKSRHVYNVGFNARTKYNSVPIQYYVFSNILHAHANTTKNGWAGCLNGV